MENTKEELLSRMKVVEINKIHLLPITDHMLGQEQMEMYKSMFQMKIEYAATLDYRPDSYETLIAIDHNELELLMEYNKKFYRAAISLCSKQVSEMIESARKCVEQDIKAGEKGYDAIYKRLLKARTANDLLKSGYYNTDYEGSRIEFIHFLIEFLLRE